MEIGEEEEKTQAPDFWNDPKKAEVLLKKIKAKKNRMEAFAKAQESFNDLKVLEDFFHDEEVSHEEMDEQFAMALKQVEELEFLQMLGEEEDNLNAILKINPGPEVRKPGLGGDAHAHVHPLWRAKRL